jgi:hypothetical protein
MDDLIQILVFVVTFIVFIASAIMKNKKKPDAKVGNFESVVESIFGIPQENLSFQKQVPVNDFYQDNFTSESFFEDEYNRPTISKENSDKKLEKLIKEEGINAIPDDINTFSDEFDADEVTERPKFDLRQAVIYSEILNRKYF